MIAITFAMELTVLCVSLYWQSSLVLAGGHFLFPQVVSVEAEQQRQGWLWDAAFAQQRRPARGNGSRWGAQVGM